MATPPKHEISKKLILFYVIALSVIALVLILSQVLVQVSISQQQSDARVINVAGRQRMLSQRLTKTAILLANPTIYRADAEHYAEDIYKIVELWKKCHDGLRTGLLELETTIPVRNSPTIDSMFTQLHPVFEILHTNALVFLHQTQNPTADKNTALNQALQNILQNERTFLKIMDSIVFQYDTEAKLRVEQLKKIELILFVITTMLLLLEGFFIFRPTYILVDTTISEMSKTEKDLYTVNEQLKEANRILYHKDQKLLRATKEKYELLLKEDKVRAMSLIQGQEEERKRISLELHDGIGQMLTGLKLIAEKLKSNSFVEEKDQKTFLDLKQLLDDTIIETRNVSFNLMPSVLNDFGVISAIKILIEQLHKLSGIQISFDYTDVKYRLPKNIEISIYRIIQEGLNNAIKHAQATKVEVTLEILLDAIQITIEDNGKGFVPNRRNKSNLAKNGVSNMQSRAYIHDGRLKINSKVGKGTKIQVELPYFLS